MTWRQPSSTLFPYTTLFRSPRGANAVRVDGVIPGVGADEAHRPVDVVADLGDGVARLAAVDDGEEDRKSTRLNSSHLGISYAVFCLKKKKRRNTSELHCN